MDIWRRPGRRVREAPVKTIQAEEWRRREASCHFYTFLEDIILWQDLQVFSARSIRTTEVWHLHRWHQMWASGGMPTLLSKWGTKVNVAAMTARNTARTPKKQFACLENPFAVGASGSPVFCFALTHDRYNSKSSSDNTYRLLAVRAEATR